MHFFEVLKVVSVWKYRRRQLILQFCCNVTHLKRLWCFGYPWAAEIACEPESSSLKHITNVWFKVSVHRLASYASHAPHATDFSLSCIETHTTACTDPHRTDRVIGNAFMRCVPMTSYGMRTIRTMRACGHLPLYNTQHPILILISTHIKNIIDTTRSDIKAKETIEHWNEIESNLKLLSDNCFTRQA
uniref:SFRICE_034355 n=1 Tax=Spodoptera frugiperda TaxID=7108 RepID=A0A2H1WDW5_SPOFR